MTLEDMTPERLALAQEMLASVMVDIERLRGEQPELSARLAELLAKCHELSAKMFEASGRPRS